MSALDSFGRQYACMTVPDQTRLMLYGGTNQTHKDPLGIAAEEGLGGLLIFSLAHNKWYQPANANAPAGGGGPVLPGCGATANRMWVYDTHYGTPNKQSTAVSLLDTVHWTWSQPTEQGQLPVVRFGAAFADAGGGRSFYMHGGIPLDDKTNLAQTPPGIANSLDILDPTQLSWSYASNGPSRKYHTLCYMPSIDGLVLFGGSDQNIPSYNDIKVFFIKNGVWEYSLSVHGQPPSERILHTSVCDTNRMVVFGGKHSLDDQPSDSSVWVLKADGPTNFTWSQAPTHPGSRGGPSARAGHSAALHNNHMYIFGGNTSDHTMYGLDLDQWEWTQLLPADNQNNDNGYTRTATIIAGIISSVLGLLVVGIACAVLYRCLRRRGSNKSQHEHENVTGASQYKDQPSMSSPVSSDNTAIQADYSEPTNNHRPKGVIQSMREHARRRHRCSLNARMIGHHHNTPLATNGVLGEYATRPNSMMVEPIYGEDHRRLEMEYRQAEAINQIILEEKPLPDWLRDKVNENSV